MKISATLNNQAKSNSCQSFKGFSANYLAMPETIGRLGRYIGNNVGTPEQKLVVATTAVLLRPLLDLKFAEEDKKVDTAIKSASKAIAGGLTGVSIRALFLYLTNKFIKFRGDGYIATQIKNLNKENIPDSAKKDLRFKLNAISRLLLPKSLEDLRIDRPVEARHKLKQYNNALGGFLAVLVMALCTNSLIDAPLTSDFQDLLGGIVKEKKTPMQSIVDVATNRYKIIKNWTNEKKNVVISFFNKTKQIFKIITNKSE